ncbi:MAG: FAD-binding protein [Coriobacteriales bacterium]|jgi:uncharacterized protein with FMN-binding domain
MSDGAEFRKRGYSKGDIEEASRGFATSPSSSRVCPDGRVSATVPGFKGDVTATLDVDKQTGEIRSVEISGDAESVGRSGDAMRKLEAAMNESKSIDVDAISSATVTSQAVLDAADYAYKMAMGQLSENAKMKPGRYETEQYGFYSGLPVKIGVTVDENSIKDIDVDDDNLEIGVMLRAVKDRYIPRMISSQALAVDAISGATVTSNAVRLGVEQCVKDAYAAAGAGTDAAFGMLRPQDIDDVPDDLEPDYTADVLVVGMGGSGISAALSAAENGAKVIAIDKAGKWGGTTCVTSESCAVNPKKFKEEFNGGSDYVDAREFEDDWASRTHGDHKQDMLDLYFAESGNTIDWLHYDHEFPYNTPNGGHADYATYDCCFTYKPYTLADQKNDLARSLGNLIRQFEELGGTYMLETEAIDFLREGDAVTGVRARRFDGSECEIHAKATIIGTGGFGCNDNLMKRFMKDDYYPLSGNWHAYGMTTNDGKMIEAALDELGAAVKNPSVPPLSHLAGFPVDILGFGTHEKDEDSFFTGRKAIWSEGDIPTTLSVAADSLAVTRAGHRFINEEHFAVHGAIVAGPEYFTIWSQEQLDNFRENGFKYADYGPSMGYLGCRSTIPLGVPLPHLDEVMQAGISTGYIHKADTIEALAEQIGIDPLVLRSTVDLYNQSCDNCRDSEFGKNPDYLDRVGEGPYYAILGCAFFYTTAGALDVNTDIQVLREDGTPIEGLYAVGTDSMGVLMTEKEQYLDYGGAASGWAFTSGRLAGKAAAKKALGK